MNAQTKFDRIYDHERRLQTMRDAAPEMFEALERIAAMGLDGRSAAKVARRALRKASGGDNHGG